MSRSVVLGGGLAGLTAAIELVDRGLEVTVIEARPYCGGKLAGWRDEEGDPIEHGIHGWWPSYANFRHLMKRVGIADGVLRRASSNLMVLPDGSRRSMEPLGATLPAPLFLAPYILRSSEGRLLDTLALLRFALSLLAFDPERDYEELDRHSFRSWLWSRGMSDRMYRLHFEPYVRSFAFSAAETVSAAAAFSSLRFYLLGHQESLIASWLTDDPQSSIVEPMVRYLESRGGEIRTGTRVEELVAADDGRRIHAVRLDDRELLEADGYVTALDLGSCQRLLRRSGLHGGALGRIGGLETTDVIVFRFWFPGGGLLGEITSGVFVGASLLDNFTVVSNMQRCARTGGETLVETSAYLVDDVIHLEEKRLIELALDDLRRRLPELEVAPRKAAVLVHRGLVAHHAAGSHRFVPDGATPFANLHLAGDWVRRRPQIWHMERAVTSGRHAASALLEASGQPGLAILTPELEGLLLRSTAFVLRRLKGAKDGLRRFLRGDRRPPRSEP